MGRPYLSYSIVTAIAEQEALPSLLPTRVAQSIDDHVLRIWSNCRHPKWCRKDGGRGSSPGRRRSASITKAQLMEVVSCHHVTIHHMDNTLVAQQGVWGYPLVPSPYQSLRLEFGQLQSFKQRPRYSESRRLESTLCEVCEVANGIDMIVLTTWPGERRPSLLGHTCIDCALTCPRYYFS